MNMKKFTSLLLMSYLTTFCFGQTSLVIENKVTLFSIEQKKDTIYFIIIDTVLTEKKPVFLWCQGSLPRPLFCEVNGLGNYFMGGGISNFDYKSIAEDYHLVVISMPKTPVLAKEENLNHNYLYVPNSEFPNQFSNAYIEADYLENYVNRANIVLKFLKKQKWVCNEKLVVAGHSQGTKVATKISVQNKRVTHLGLFSANPFGRVGESIREARLDAQLGKISWEKADSIMNDNYEFYEEVNTMDSMITNPGYKAWQSFSETFYDDWLILDIPIYLGYGTEDRTADLCDIMPLFFIEKGKTNLTLKRYLGLEHNFFELTDEGNVNYQKPHYDEVMEAFMNWLE